MSAIRNLFKKAGKQFEICSYCRVTEEGITSSWSFRNTKCLGGECGFYICSSCRSRGNKYCYSCLQVEQEVRFRYLESTLDEKKYLICSKNILEVEFFLKKKDAYFIYLLVEWLFFTGLVGAVEIDFIFESKNFHKSVTLLGQNEDVFRIKEPVKPKEREFSKIETKPITQIEIFCDRAVHSHP